MRASCHMWIRNAKRIRCRKMMSRHLSTHVTKNVAHCSQAREPRGFCAVVRLRVSRRNSRGSGCFRACAGALKRRELVYGRTGPEMTRTSCAARRRRLPNFSELFVPAVAAKLPDVVPSPVPPRERRPIRRRTTFAGRVRSTRFRPARRRVRSPTRRTTSRRRSSGRRNRSNRRRPGRHPRLRTSGRC